MRSWRRPSARWVYPYVLAVTLFNGMSHSQLPSLVLDIVCMAHPPSAPLVEMPATRRLAGHLPPAQSPQSDSKIWADASFARSISYMHGGVAEAADGSTKDGLKKPATTLLVGTALDDIDPKACRRDVGVQRLTAKVNLWSNAIASILNVVTTAYWSDRSDRVGRKPVLVVAQMAFLACDAMFLMCAVNPKVVSTFGVGVLLLGPTLLALLGGGPVSGRVCQAYLADTCNGNLVGHFSLLLGFLAIGSTLGPILATYLVERFNDRLITFKISIAVSLCLIAYLFAALPESLSKDVKENNIRMFQEAKDKKREAQEGNSLLGQQRSTGASRLVVVLHQSLLFARRGLSLCVSILEPLQVFRPREASASSSGRRDYNLLLLAIGVFLVDSVRGDSASALQYTMFVFGWDQSQIAPYLSMRALGQVAVLMGLLPLVTRFFRTPSSDTVDISSAPDVENCFQGPTETTSLLSKAKDQPPERLYGESNDPSSDQISPHPSRSCRNAISPRHAKAESHFDQRILLMCLFAELLANVVIGTNASGSATVFVVATGIGSSLGAPADSSWSTLMIRLAKDSQPGRVLGAHGVITALSKLTGNVVFSLLWSATLTTYPPAIFLVASALYIATFVVISRLRV